MSQAEAEKNSVAGEAEAGLDAMLFARAVRKHWLMVLIVGLAVSIGAAFYALGQKRIYRSTSTIIIDPNPPRPLGRETSQVLDFTSYWTNQEYHETQLKIITSRKVASATVERLGLRGDQAFLQNAPPGVRPSGPDATLEQAASALMGRASVESQKSTRLVKVSVEDADPERAQRLAAALVDTYVQQNLDDVATSSSSATDWLRTQVGNLNQELESSEIALHNYKKDKNILSLSLGDQTNMLRGEMEKLNDRLTEVRAERERVAARLAELARVNPEDPEKLPATEVLTSPLLASLRDAYVTAKRERDSIAAEGRGPQHPSVRAAEARLGSTREALIGEVRNVQHGVAKDLAVLERELKGLAGLFAGAKREALDLNLLEIEYKRLERLKDNNEKLYALVLERSKESDLASLQQVNNVRVMDAPLRGAPVRPNVLMLILAGVGLGVGLGVGAALARELVDRTIRTAEQLEQDLGLSFLGLLPSAGSFAAGYSGYAYGRRRGGRSAQDKAIGPPELMVHARATSAIAEAARAVRTNIMFMAPDRPARTLLVTSASPGEGKTTVACWIATAMAQAGQRVLLVDCDLRRPRLHRIFQRPNDAGLTLSLIDRGGIDPDSLATGVPNLSVLASGPHAPNPAELLQSAAFGELLRDLASAYDRVILDSPPISPVTDAIILSTRVDGTVLVCRAMSTGREQGRRAVRAIRAVGGHIVGAVLNDVRPGRSRYGAGAAEYYYQREAPAEST